MANISDSALTVLADQIQDETTAGANTALRIGTFLNDIVDSKINHEDLDNVDNTSDVDKPVSTAQAAAIAVAVAAAITTVKVSLSSAQILAGFTTPVSLVAAKGAGTFINVLSIAKRLTYGSITYITNTTDRVYIGSFSPIITDGDILASASNDFSVTSPTQSLEVTGSADWVNAPLMWKVITGNPASGNSTLDIYITYNVITL